MTRERDWSAAIFVDGVGGVLAVRKRLKSGLWGHWHLPGGKKDPGEADIYETAYRELWEETGIDANHASLEILHREERSIIKSVSRRGRKVSYRHTYDLYFCRVSLKNIEEIQLRSIIVHEQVRLIPFDEFKAIDNFTNSHREFIEMFGLIPDTAPA